MMRTLGKRAKPAASAVAAILLSGMMWESRILLSKSNTNVNLGESGRQIRFDEGSFHNSAPTKKSKRWAVMMIGAGRSYAFTRNTFLKKVVNQTHPPMDIFTYSYDVSDSCLVDGLSTYLLEQDSILFHLDTSTPSYGRNDEHAITHDRFVRQQLELLQMIDDHSKAKNVTYDFIFYTRPDLYYTIPFNISGIEAKLEDKSNNSSLFSPQCCGFSGWCDRLAAASHLHFSNMVRAGSKWWSQSGHQYTYESAFKDRAEFANLSAFDMILKEDYGFLTLRMDRAREACNGAQISGAHWTENYCDNFAAFDNLDSITPVSCELLNKSSSCK